MSLRNLSILCILVTVLTLPFTWQRHINGDGLEYIIQTQSFVFDYSTSIDTSKRREYWNKTNPYGIKLRETVPAKPRDTLTELDQSQGGFGGLYPDNNGKYRYYHFWLYSLAVAPLYFVIQLLSPTLAYGSFQLFNQLCFATVLIYSFIQVRSLLARATIVSLIFSPYFGYTIWHHPELFQFTLVFFAFVFTRSEKTSLFGPIVLGLAAAQNVPIALFFPLHFYFSLQSQKKISVILCCGYLFGSVLAASSLLFYLSTFGVPSVISSIGQASLEYASLERTFSLFIGPLIGALWLLPFLTIMMLISIRLRNVPQLLLILLSTLLVVWLCTATVNLNSGHLGISRYMTWALAPLFWYLLLYQDNQLRSIPHPVQMSLVVVGIIVGSYFHLHEIPLGKHYRFYERFRAQPDTGRLYKYLNLRDDLEVLVENIRREELPTPKDFDGIYIWNISDNFSIWVISKKAFKHAKSFSWDIEEIPKYISSPANEVFRKRSRDISLRKKGIQEFYNHSIFGEYVIIKVEKSAKKIRTDSPLFINNSI